MSRGDAEAAMSRARARKGEQGSRAMNGCRGGDELFERTQIIF
jgi:hypothetical protein